jgi:choice-of-anchor A domain-containing protein
VIDADFGDVCGAGFAHASWSVCTQRDDGGKNRLVPRSLTLRALTGVAPISAILAAAAAVVFTVGPASAAVSTSPLAPPLGPCSGTQCPSAWPPPGVQDFPGRDASINVFAGGDYTAAERAAESEGKIVVLGDMTVAKTGGGSFNIGVAVGSRVPPPNGDDYLTVGGDLTVNTGDTMLVGGSDSHGIAWGNVRYAGVQGGGGVIDIAPTGSLIHDVNAAAPYLPLVDVLQNRSHCAEDTVANGSVTAESGQVTFTGDGTSALQVFDMTGDIGTASSAVGIVFQNIPAGATIVVNMLGASPLINTYSGSGAPGDPLATLRPKLLWNFPTATSATVKAGNIVHQGSGSELHSYPFDGSIPDCSEPSESPTETASTAHSVNGSESASPTESESGLESGTPSQSASATESASPTVSPTGTTSPSPGAPGQRSPQPSNTGRVPLAHTGAEIEGPASIAVALLALGTLLAFGTRFIRRTKGRRKD